MLSIERIEGKAAGNQSITRSGCAIAEGTAESLRLHSSAAKHVAGQIVIGEHHTSQANKIDLAGPARRGLALGLKGFVAAIVGEIEIAPPQPPSQKRPPAGVA